MKPTEQERAQDHSQQRAQELRRLIARSLILGRWAMLPLFVGLLIAMALLIVAFFMQLWNFGINLASMSETAVIMKLLTLIDMALVGGLIVIVVSSGYENFVARLERRPGDDWPAWMASISFAGLKFKLFATLMAITAIALLKALIRLETDVSEAQVKWLVIANVVFIAAYLALAFAGRLNSHEDGPPS